MKTLSLTSLLLLCLAFISTVITELRVNGLVTKSLGVYSNVIDEMERIETEDSLSTKDGISGKEIETDYRLSKNGDYVKLFIPFILLDSTQTIADADSIFKSYSVDDFNFKINPTFSEGTYYYLGERNGEKEYLSYNFLYEYCIDLDDSGSCDNGESWAIR